MLGLIFGFLCLCMVSFTELAVMLGDIGQCETLKG